MSVWIKNLKSRLEDRPVVILHGNVRDRYIDEHGRPYDNLTSLLGEIARSMPFPFSELVFYDPVGNERRRLVKPSGVPEVRPKDTTEDDEFAGTAPQQPLEKRIQPTQVLALWQQQLSDEAAYHFAVLFYLDKLITYKTAYQPQEEEILLRLEKVIENVTPHNRLVMVALQDTMIPIELYTNSPKTSLIPIPMPDKPDRLAYLEHRLKAEPSRLELMADLTDGLFLRDLDNIALIVGEETLSTQEVRRRVNKYRVGEQQDYWGQLSIEKLENAMEWFEEEGGVKGQAEALHKIMDMLYLARASLSGLSSGTSSKPKGVLFFAGPTGVGKTFAAKKLAEFLFSTEEAFLRFDMSEFKEEHTVSKLIGSPPGYVGYERGGLLTNAVREKPFSVILFDEIEKAHPKILDIFLQLLDEGRLTDSRGQTVFFTETVIVFTSNLGTRTTDSRGMLVNEQKVLEGILSESLSHQEKKQKIREHFTRAVERFFMIEISRPELLNRIGSNIVPFNYIHTHDVQREIFKSHLRRIERDFADRHRSAEYRLEFASDPIAEWLVQKYGDRISKFGGRGVTTAIEDETMIPLACAVLNAEHLQRHSVTFYVDLNAEGEIEAREK
jgi:ATP-dependent Clp protease ATP-binding subunit ClpA